MVCSEIVGGRTTYVCPIIHLQLCVGEAGRKNNV